MTQPRCCMRCEEKEMLKSEGGVVEVGGEESLHDSNNSRPMQAVAHRYSLFPKRRALLAHHPTFHLPPHQQGSNCLTFSNAWTIATVQRLRLAAPGTEVESRGPISTVPVSIEGLKPSVTPGCALAMSSRLQTQGTLLLTDDLPNAIARCTRY
jgi:hypothetical protein